MVEIQNIREKVVSVDHRLKYVEYRAIDLEARSRRSNLVFFGIDESKDEVCDRVVRDFLADKLGIAKSVDIYMQMAHRIGKRTQITPRGIKPRPRPIIVAFRDFADIDMIMSSVGALRGTGLGVTRDFSSEINDARKRLMPVFKQARAENKSPKIIFPAKLIVDNKVVRDEFPDWNLVLYRRGSVVAGSRDGSPPIVNTGERGAGETGGATTARGAIGGVLTKDPGRRNSGENTED
jgi:hypothetical protein